MAKKETTKGVYGLPTREVPNASSTRERLKASQKLNTVRKGKLSMEVLKARIKKNLPRFDY